MAEEQERLMTMLRAAYEAGRKAALFDQTDGGRQRSATAHARRPGALQHPVEDEDWQH